MLGFKNYGNKFLRKYVMKILLPDGELNTGLPRDRRGYSPLYYRGLLVDVATAYLMMDIFLIT